MAETGKIRTLRHVEDIGGLGVSRAGRLLQSIRRDMDLTDGLMRPRKRNEEILSLVYQGSTDTSRSPMGGGDQWENLRNHALNLPYRYLRWFESQATSKKMVLKVDRNAGPGQIPGGPGDETTGMWVGEALTRISYDGGMERELKAVINEVVPRGTSVMEIGYHEDAISLATAKEAGKDAASVGPDALSGDLEAKRGQDHVKISKGLGAAAEDEMVGLTVGLDGIGDLLARKASHDDEVEKEATDDTPIVNTRLIRRKVYMRKCRVGEDVGWAPHVYDVEDTNFWWRRYIWTVAEVKQSDLFTPAFKKVVEGFDGRNLSLVASGGEMPSTDDMSTDGREAQSEDVLDDDERFVEFFMVWFRRPNMLSGGIRRIVCNETPEVFVHADDANPNVDDDGACVIPGFYPFYDFTPIQSSMTVPARTKGVPPMAVGMTQFEKIAEYNKLRQESALRHSLRLYGIHPALKDNKALLNALKNGECGFAFVEDQGQVVGGKMVPGVTMYQFTGNTQEIDRQAAREEADWVKVMGMPPAVLQGMGTAETATQDQQGIAAGERESGTVSGYFQKRMGDVMAGLRGLVRANYDDGDFIPMLGAEGAQVMKAWQDGSDDFGDRITLTFGSEAQAQAIVERKQLMDAIALIRMEVEPLTGLPIYGRHLLVEELFRRMDVGKPKPDETPMKQLQQMVLMMAQEIEGLTGVNPLTGEGQEKTNGQAGSKGSGSPRKSEGGGPTQGNQNAGARRGTVSPEQSTTGA